MNPGSLRALLSQFASSLWCHRQIDTTDTTVQWLPIFRIETHSYGLTKEGRWTAEYADNTRIAAPGMYIPFAPILELERFKFIELLSARIEEVGLPWPVLLTFPFDELVYTALEKMGNYWKKLAIGWLEAGYPMNQRIADALGDKHALVQQWRTTRIYQIVGEL